MSTQTSSLDTSEVLELEDDTKPSRSRKVKKRKAARSLAPDLEFLLQESIALSKQVFEQNEKIKRRLTWMSIASYMRLLIVLVPLVLAFIYLPPLLDEMMGQYSVLFESVSSGEPVDTQDLLRNLSPEQVEDLLRVIR